MEKKIYNQNELIENASNILKTVFNGYYETRLLRVDLKTKDWTHAINTARRMPLTTLYEEEKRKELIRIFLILRGDVISQEECLQSGFVHPIGEHDTQTGEATAASTEELDTTAAPTDEATAETAEAPVEEALGNVAPAETTETAENAALEVVTETPAAMPFEEETDMSAPAETEAETEAEIEAPAEESATEESVAEETASEESPAEESATDETSSEDTTEADPVETIVEASEEKADEIAAETEEAPKSRRRKK